MRVIIKILVILNILFASIVAIAEEQINIIPRYKVADYDKQFSKLYTKQHDKKMSGLQKLEYFSAAFLQQPYLNGALGEGTEGKFDKSPLYRPDAFDCVTYVSTVLALVHSNNVEQFKQKIADINYKDGKIAYENRNHFTSVDWNPNNEQHGFIKDITMTIHDKNNQPVAEIAKAYINKKGWYEKKNLSSIKLFAPITLAKQQQLLQQLHELKNNVSNQESHLPYVPLNALFDEKGQVNQFLFDQIPSGSIIEIIRPNWNLTPYIGTNLNVSHVGFGLRTQQGLVYREASSTENKVVDVPLIEYLHGYLNSPTVKGINIQLILYQNGMEMMYE